MNESPLISVVVPIYNVENYLDKCISSITNQTYRNLEIVLVDDESPDNCPQMCDDWERKDPRISVLHLKNGGAGYARNRGIEHIHGEWCVLVDSDDYLHRNMIRHLYLMINDNVDLTECCIVNTDSDSAEFSSDDEKEEIITCNSEGALSCLMNDRIFRQTPPNKLYRTSIIKNIKFPEGNLIDDEFWTYRVYGECNLLKHSSMKLYAYRQQTGSVMHKRYSLKRLQAIDAKYERLQYISTRYPALVEKARISLIGTCIYQAQMVEKYCVGEEKQKGLNIIEGYFRKVKLEKDEKKKVRIKQRIWFELAGISLKATVKLKNLLGIGL